MNLYLIALFSSNNLPRIKDRVYVIYQMIKIVKGHIGFHYILIKIQRYTLILLGLNIFLYKYWKNSKINQILTIYLEYKTMNLLCVDFIVPSSEYIVPRKS